MLEPADQRSHVFHDLLKCRTVLRHAAFSRSRFSIKLDLPNRIRFGATRTAKDMTGMQSELRQDIAGVQPPSVDFIALPRLRVVTVLVNGPLLHSGRRGMDDGMPR